MPPPTHTKGRREAVIVVRIDDMDTLETKVQRSVRFELTTDGHYLPPNDLVHMALKQAPSINEWERF